MQTKIFFIIKDYRGGIERFLEQIASIDPDKFIPYFVFLSKDKFSNFPKSNVYFLNTQENSSFSFSKTLEYLNVTLRLARLIRELSPDIVVSFPIFPFVATTFVKTFFKLDFVNVIIINNNINFLLWRKFFLIRMLAKKMFQFSLIKNTNTAIFISKELKLGFLKMFNHDNIKIKEVIYHGVDITKVKNELRILYTKESVSRYKENSNHNIISIGRLEDQKDFVTLIRAFAIVSINSSKSRLYIIGDGPQKQMLKDLANKLDVFRKVHFVGWKKNIYKYLKYSDIFVFSSNYEGFGTVIVEAMACGIPVISTNTPYGPSEILKKGKYGILIPVGDYKKMAEEILKLASDKTLAMKYSKLGKARVKLYDSKKMVKKYEKLFLKLRKNEN